MDSAGRRADLDTVEDLGVEHVDTGVDSVADEFDWLFNESVDNGGSWLGDDHTVVGWFGDLRDLNESVMNANEEEREGREGGYTMMDPSPPWDKWKSLHGQLDCSGSGSGSEEIAYRNSSNG